MTTLERTARQSPALPRTAHRAPRTRSRRPPWPIWLGTTITFALSLAAALWYWHATDGFTPRAATPVGRWYGGVGAGLMALLTLYVVRRRCYRRRMGSLEVWYRAHLWVGVLALALVGVHCGFRTRGLFLSFMQIAFWGSVGSGMVGWLLQSRLKEALRRYEPRPSVMTEIARGIAAARGALASLLPTVETGELASLFRRLAAVRRRHLWRFPTWPAWDAMATAQGGHALSRHLNCLDPADTTTVLEAVVRVNHIEVLASYHRWLRAWTTIHLALALAAVQLVAWHIYLTTAY